MQNPILKAGAGSAPIHFPKEVFPADGIMAVHDDPYFRVLVLDCGRRVALCSAEMVNLPEDGIAMAKHIVGTATQTAPEDVWVHVTHAISTPHAPYDPAKGGMPPPPGKEDPESPRKRSFYTAALETAITEAARQAAETFSTAVLSVGQGESNVNINRDVETPFGWWLGHNPEGFSNKTATVLRLDRPDGGLIAVMVSYGLKPCAIDNSEMDKGTRLASSDLVGRTMLLLEQELGVPCLFFMSAAGDQVPREQAWFEGVDDNGQVVQVDFGVQTGLEIVERLSAEFAYDLRPVIRGAAPVEAAEIVRGSTSVIWQTKARPPMRPQKSVEVQLDGSRVIGTELIALGDIALVAAKPEINAVTERELQAASPYGTTLLISFVDGGMKYMPDASAYDRVTWESQSSMLMKGAAEAWVKQTAAALTDLKNGAALPAVTAVAEPRPDGERITKAIVEFADSVPAPDGLGVVGRTVMSRTREGNRVTLILSEDDEDALVIPKPKRGPGGPGGPGRPGGPGGPRGKMDARKLPARLRTPIRLAVTLPGLALQAVSSHVRELVIEQFTQGQYKSMAYNLFVPEITIPGEKYPLVLFIPDASVNGSDPLLPLSQGIGATVWAEPEWQAEHPCYVLAVQVPKHVFLTNDDNEAAPEIEDIKGLLDKVIAEHSVDPERIYATGQSQGCMASCELNLRYPDLFAASMLVSGQWDLERMSTLTQKEFFIGVSEGGPKEYPFMEAWTKRLTEQGVAVSEVRLNFREGWEHNDDKVRDAAEGAQVVYAVFDEATAFPDDGVARPKGAHHSRGWELTYQLESAREWLFQQKR